MRRENKALSPAATLSSKGRDKMQSHTRLTTGLFGVLGVFAVSSELIAQSIPLLGIPASDSLSAEDIWQNPTFVGGVVNGGPTAHSEW